MAMETLGQFMQQHISPTTFERLVTETDGFGVGAELVRGELPLAAGNLAQYYHGALELLAQHGILEEPAFYQALIAVRPHRAEAVRTLATRRGVVFTALTLTVRTAVTLQVGALAPKLTSLVPWLVAVAVASTVLYVAHPGTCPPSAAPPEQSAPAPVMGRVRVAHVPDADTEIIILDEEDIVVLDDVPANRSPDAGPRTTPTVKRPAARNVVPSVPVASNTPQGIPPSHFDIKGQLDRCSGELQRAVSSEMPGFARQSHLDGHASGRMSLIVEVASDGRTLRVGTDQLWSGVNSAVISSVRDMRLPAALSSASCVCKLDLKGATATCKQQG